jgi:hypothetical protein
VLGPKQILWSLAEEVVVLYGVDQLEHLAQAYAQIHHLHLPPISKKKK